MPTTEIALPTVLESTYIVVWEFQVKAECEAEFVTAYGPDGEWARLFRRSPELMDQVHRRREIFAIFLQYLSQFTCMWRCNRPFGSKSSSLSTKPFSLRSH